MSRPAQLPFGRYVIFSEPIEEGIDAVRVLHGARYGPVAANQSLEDSLAGSERP